ncbi:unnamed protein product [Prunus armeniaca]
MDSNGKGIVELPTGWSHDYIHRHLPVGASVTLMPLGSKDSGKDRLRTTLIQSQLLDYFFGNLYCLWPG